MTHDHRSDDHDQAQERDGARRDRGDWWTALTDWFAARPPRTTEPEDRPRAHRGPDGRIYYGCVIPPGAVPVRGEAHDDISGAGGGFRARREHTADAASGDLADDDGAGL